MRFLLDTNVVSELRKARPHGAVAAWYAAEGRVGSVLASIVLYELQRGADITRKQDAGKADQIEAWIEALQAEATILPLDAASARKAARLMQKQPERLIADAMIAAIASTNGLTVATRNVRDFEKLGVPFVNPFTFQS